MAVDALARAIAAGKTPVTAYDEAVKAGYTGTEEQFAQDMGNSATNAANAAASASAAAASAESISASAAQIATNTSDISDLKTQLNSSMYATQDWLVDGNVEYDDNEIPVAYDIVWADGVQGRVSKSTFDSDVMEYTTITATHGANTVTYHVEFDENGYVTSESYTIS